MSNTNSGAASTHGAKADPYQDPTFNQPPDMAALARLQEAEAAQQIGLSIEMRACIDLCLACQTCCREAMDHGLGADPPQSQTPHARLMANCAEMCGVAASFLLSGSPFHAQVCAVCAQVCDACAQSCQAFENQNMAECAELCRGCADSCREVASLDVWNVSPQLHEVHADAPMPHRMTDAAAPS